MNAALLLVGSPRGRKSTSTSIGQYVLDRLTSAGYMTNTQWIKEQVTSEEKIGAMLEAVQASDVILLTAPLYDDCQPYIVTKAMEAIQTQLKDLAEKRFFPIINCGFPEYEQITASALPIYRCFASAVGLKWAGSLALGGGEMLRGSEGLRLDQLGKVAESVRVRLRGIAESLVKGIPYTDDAMVAYPKFLAKPIFGKLMTRMNNSGWRSRAAKNNADVVARPYDPA